MSLSFSHLAPSSNVLPALTLRTRPAEFRDALAIHRLIESLSFDGTLLRRSYLEICQSIETFTVIESDIQGFLGCAALHTYGPHLAEVRSIAVRPEVRGLGAGAMLVEALLARTRREGIGALCLFTRIPAFFARVGFRVIDRHSIPEKVAKDCRNCSRNRCCDETAMLLGYLPPQGLPTQNVATSQNLVQIRCGRVA